jgi:hypothetical protein
MPCARSLALRFLYIIVILKGKNTMENKDKHQLQTIATLPSVE